MNARSRKMTLTAVVVAVVAFIGFLTYTTFHRPDSGTAAGANQPVRYRTVSIDELAQLATDPAVTLINVHVPYTGEIPGTDLFIPFNQIKENLKKLPRDKSAKIVVYCRSGHMSKMASETLARLGYTRIYDVPGGMNAWSRAGRYLQQG